MRITSRGLAAATVGLVSAVALAGCSGSSTKPTVLPSLPTTTAVPVATTSAAPAPTTPAVVPSTPTATIGTSSPAAATATPSLVPTAPSSSTILDPKLIAQITNAVKTYYATADDAQRDATLLPKWRGLFIDSCSQCLADYTTVKKELSLGARYVGGGYEIRHLSIVAMASDSALVDINFVLLGAKVYDKNGKLIDHLSTSAGRKASVSLALETNWYIVNYHSDDVP